MALCVLCFLFCLFMGVGGLGGRLGKVVGVGWWRRCSHPSRTAAVSIHIHAQKPTPPPSPPPYRPHLVHLALVPGNGLVVHDPPAINQLQPPRPHEPPKGPPLAGGGVLFA